MEYCDPTAAIKREQYYLDLQKPEYNILPTAGSLLGYKHSEETKANFKSRRYTLEHIAKIRVESLSPKHIEQLKHLKYSPERMSQRLEHLNCLNAMKAHNKKPDV